MSTPTLATIQAMHRASSLLQAGQFAQARGALENVVKADPGFVEGHRLLAGALLGLGDRAAAEQALRVALSLQPNWAPVLVALGELLLEQGRTAEAEVMLRRASANGASYPRATLSLARLLLGSGRAAEACGLVAPQAQAASASSEVLFEYGRALLDLHRNEEAVDAFRRVVGAAPASAVAHARLADACNTTEHFPEAAKAARRAIELGFDSAAIWFLLGHAAVGTNQFDEAETALRTACARDPYYVEAQSELAQLIWMRTGDLSAASIHLDAALRAQPGHPGLLAFKASLYQSAGDAAGALELLLTAASDANAHPPLLLTACEAALKISSPQALEFARRAFAMAPQEPATIRMLGHALLNAGYAGEARQLALQALAHHPDDQSFIALLATAMRLDGDLRYREIYDYAALVRTWTIDTPPGWPDLPSYLAALAVSLRRLHTLHTHPVHQSLRHGTQTTQNLLRTGDPTIRAFFTAIDGPIRRHLAAIGRGSDPTRSRNRGGYRIHGIWSVQLQPNGYHTNHVHPEGWLSSACYIDLPQAIERGHEGWLKFGEPGEATRPPLPPEHFVRPAPGLLALFPSHMWHGTVPFSGEGTRLTIAFDVVPG